MGLAPFASRKDPKYCACLLDSARSLEKKTEVIPLTFAISDFPMGNHASSETMGKVIWDEKKTEK